jgi:hypothetical protein
MCDHNLVKFIEDRGEDKAEADEDGAHDEQKAGTILVEEQAHECCGKELASAFVTRGSRGS